MRSEALYNDDFVCVVSAANEDVSEKIGIKQYFAMPHIALRLGGGIRSVIEAAWRKLGMSPPVSATTSSFAAMLFMVSDSRLVATVQRRLARRFACMLPIRILERPIEIEPLHANMYWPASRDDDPGHRFLRMTFAAAGNHDPQYKPSL